MKKKIIIEVDSEEDNEKIESYAKKWASENFFKESKVSIEDAR